MNELEEVQAISDFHFVNRNRRKVLFARSRGSTVLGIGISNPIDFHFVFMKSAAQVVTFASKGSS